ncbi:MAG: response regulator [Cyanobacteria bacterium CRU_2_1]|nr:response regulator [Cyanobacteria bacterium RU_5_0]NJR61116.1 response regulator [Cyanobacteria bacterium CRU_2_1]
MGDFRKFVVMIQPMSRQGAIWQAILRSQEISVIWESPDVNLCDSLTHLKATGATLPDLLLIDTRLQTLNPYTFCRWSHKHCPTVKVVLVNGAQKEITPSEREWAIYQGAADLMPRFQRDSLVSGAVVKARRILDILDCTTLDSGALISALLGSSQDLCQKIHDL